MQNGDGVRVWFFVRRRENCKSSADVYSYRIVVANLVKGTLAFIYDWSNSDQISPIHHIVNGTYLKRPIICASNAA